MRARCEGVIEGGRGVRVDKGEEMGVGEGMGRGVGLGGERGMKRKDGGGGGSVAADESIGRLGCGVRSTLPSPAL